MGRKMYSDLLVTLLNAVMMNRVTPFLYWAMTAMALVSTQITFLKQMTLTGKSREQHHGKSPLRIASLLVPKKFFLHFYVFALFSLVVFVLLHPRSTTISASLILLNLHLIRRLFECIWIHRWRETSQMHLTAYLVGHAHYLCLPWALLGSANSSEHLSGGLQHSILLSFLALCCLAAQYTQHTHHVLLAKIDQTRHQSSSQFDRPYTLPTRTQTRSNRINNWLQSRLVCPHYFCEILIYVFLCLTAFVEGCGRSGLTLLSLVVWVTTNLSISASHQYRYFEIRAPVQVKGRYRIIPLIY